MRLCKQYSKIHKMQDLCGFSKHNKATLFRPNIANKQQLNHSFCFIFPLLISFSIKLLLSSILHPQCQVSRSGVKGWRKILFTLQCLSFPNKCKVSQKLLRSQRKDPGTNIFDSCSVLMTGPNQLLFVCLMQ